MLEFRNLLSQDLPFLLEVRNECREYLHDNRAFTLVECEAWYRDQNPDFRVVSFDGNRIGYFRLSMHDPEDSSIYVGADLHERFRGRGMAKMVYEQFLPIVRVEYSVTMAKLEVLSHNAVAVGLYQTLGFVEFGRVENYTKRNGVSVDNILMAKRL